MVSGKLQFVVCACYRATCQGHGKLQFAGEAMGSRLTAYSRSDSGRGTSSISAI